MERFFLSGTVTISVYTQIEAETLREAIKMAKVRENMDIIHDGSSDVNEYWMTDGLDGEICDIKED